MGKLAMIPLPLIEKCGSPSSGGIDLVEKLLENVDHDKYSTHFAGRWPNFRSLFLKDCLQVRKKKPLLDGPESFFKTFCQPPQHRRRLGVVLN